MKRILLIVIAAVLACQADGQQLPRRTQFALNPYLINPAVAGTKLYTPIMVTYRNQWAGFTSAPTTATLSAHTSLPNRIGIGGCLLYTSPRPRDGLLSRMPSSA